MAGENGNKYIDIIKPVLTEMDGTGNKLYSKLSTLPYLWMKLPQNLKI